MSSGVAPKAVVSTDRAKLKNMPSDHPCNIIIMSHMHVANLHDFTNINANKDTVNFCHG